MSEIIYVDEIEPVTGRRGSASSRPDCPNPRGNEQRRSGDGRRGAEHGADADPGRRLERPLDTFEQRHKPDVVVRWPGKPPTHGTDDHRQEAIDFFTAFPDQHLDNRPYKVFFASGDWTCSIAHFTGTFTGPMKGPDGEEIPPTGKSFQVDFCTVAKWHDGQIVEENLFYDLVTFVKQIGLSE